MLRFTVIALLHIISAGICAAQFPRHQWPANCAPCETVVCAPKPAGGCATGPAVRDPCGCCELCPAGEGDPCGAAIRCGPGLQCIFKEKVEKKGRGKSGVCVCKSHSEVCGSDGVTYRNLCELKAASWKAQKRGASEIRSTGKGACSQAPSIATPPQNIWNVTGARVYLSCETIGIPTPILTWNKIKRTSSGVQKTELLPGDRENLAIQTRGGPEKHEVTGWVLIFPLREEDAGEYECKAANSKGEAAASATITIVKSLDELPGRRDPGKEL
ncbi:insulin-like growth factor-binding protein 7 isoform X1 [Protopterus annectens]|uniref:insulin-like growth factor-binding protein 7 isoform X1 n=1 Tax=Protopterus annectens TaxID=7888 RepID=UPI001CF985E1|nr:insulin-like growth factor-binding protein 7 isoform X1 [Protopterus annectens]